VSKLDIFSDRCLLLTGGTGSFGNADLRRFWNTDIREVRMFSCDQMLILNLHYRTRLASAASQRAKTYSWPRRADETSAALATATCVESQ